MTSRTKKKPASPKKPSPDTEQMNLRQPTALVESIANLTAGRGTREFNDFVRSGLEFWCQLAEEAANDGRTPHELAAVMHSDHVAVDSLVAAIQEAAATRTLTKIELDLLQRFDPALWRRHTGTVR